MLKKERSKTIDKLFLKNALVIFILIFVPIALLKITRGDVEATGVIFFIILATLFAVTD